MDESNPDFSFVFHPHRRQEFRDGIVWRQWREQYPQLFDERDEELALTMAKKEQGGSHFFEWLGAVLLYESTGLLSMQANFIAKNHPSKRKRFLEIVGPAVFEHVDGAQAGLPDLFVYSPIRDYWFFCEVKGGPDRIRKNQCERFSSLKAMTGKHVSIMKFRELPR